MTTLKLNDATARELVDAAAALGMSVDEYVRSRILPYHPSTEKFSANRFDKELDSLLHAGPSLPADFSRADIYVDHD